jgi:hypothetical protein
MIIILLFVISCIMCPNQNLVKCGWKGTGWFLLVAALLSIEAAGSPERAGEMIGLAFFFIVPIGIWTPVGIHAIIRRGQSETSVSDDYRQIRSGQGCPDHVREWSANFLGQPSSDLQ